MGLIREPKNVDFTVIDNPWTEEERKEFSELIKKEKAKQSAIILSTKTLDKKHIA
jgi:hypothetical protein